MDLFGFYAKIFLCILHLAQLTFWFYYFSYHAFYGVNSTVKPTTSLNWNGSRNRAPY